MKSLRATTFALLAVLGTLVPSAASAASATRTSSFCYDDANAAQDPSCPPATSNSGLLTREVVEPNKPTLRLQTDYGYDAYGNKTSTTVSGGVSGDSSYVAQRTSSAAYDSQGEFATQQTNALGQSESWQY